MGLSQYAYSINAGVSLEDAFDEDHEIIEGELIAYWRKHNNLQGWMGNLWREKGGEGIFDTTYLEITLEDLDRLEKDVRGQNLPLTEESWFFSKASSDTDKRFLKEDLEFIKESRQAIAEGKTIYYDSWF